MNERCFEVFPERRGVISGSGKGPPTGQLVWHFRAGNGQIVAIGGESFTRREDAHRSIAGVIGDLESSINVASRIVDLDENGDVIDADAGEKIPPALADALEGPTSPTPEDAVGEVPENEG